MSIFLKIYGFKDYNKFWFLACEQLTCLCIICPVFVVSEKLSWEKLDNKVLKLYWILNFTHCTAVFISSTACDGDLTPPILPGGKNSRSTPVFKDKINPVIENHGYQDFFDKILMHTSAP